MYPQYPSPYQPPVPAASTVAYGGPQAYGQPAYPTPVPQQPAPVAMPPASNGGVPQMPGMSDARVGGGGGASIRELEGRAVIVMPTRIERGVTTQLKKEGKEDRVTLTVWVLDGGPLSYGANVQPPSPPTHRVDTVPCRLDGVLSSHGNIIRAVEGSIDPVTQRPTGVVLGRIVRGVTSTAGNSNPWNLRPLDDNQPADAQARQIAAQVQQQVNAGTFVNPTPVDLASAANAYAPAPGVPYGQQPAVQQAPADTPPPGFPPGLWATLTPEQKASYLAGLGQAPAAPPMPTGY